jgi:NAD(P)-dependent dehydrogenase (short-subunit alcohol dehydrogenase family)
MTEQQSAFSLAGKTIVLAGASRGIGHALANGLARAGASVTGFGRTEKIEGASFRYLRCDSNNEVEVTKLFDEIESRCNGIDGYVHVAGMTTPTRDALQSGDAFAATINTNLTGAYRCCRDVGLRMIPRARGSIVTVTSIGSVLGFPNNPGYVAAKGGLRMMSKALALDLGRHAIRVNCLVPGYIHTDMTAASYADPAANAERAQRTMLGRWGQVDDLVGAAVFLLSDASCYITGSDLFVDGGWSAKGL